jgi:hypothetical protein
MAHGQAVMLIEGTTPMRDMMVALLSRRCWLLRDPHVADVAQGIAPPFAQARSFRYAMSWFTILDHAWNSSGLEFSTLVRRWNGERRRPVSVDDWCSGSPRIGGRRGSSSRFA